MSYRPLGNDSATATSFSGGNIDVSQSVDTQLMARSQRPCCYFNPQDQRGCSMTLPFIKEDNWITLSSGGPLSRQYVAELQRMGTLNLDSFVPLEMSNGSAGQAVEITIYAWASDVELMGPSAAFQSGMADEYGTSPVSDVATAVASASGALSNVPTIGPYARATGMVASSVAAVAKALGYSKPPNIGPITPYKYLTNPSMANASIPVPSDVLAVDPKNELTVDPRTVCTGSSDPNLISDIVQKDSYWFTTTWNVSDPTSTTLAEFAVTPEVFRSEHRIGTGYTGNYWLKQMSPMCHMSQVFTHWQGDIIYTFRFVCSKYHRGRVRIFYEPEGLGAPVLDSAYNINHIVDIGSTTTFEMRVPYMRSTSWAKVRHAALAVDNTPLYKIRAGSGFTYTGDSMNGKVTISVLNDLSAPSTTANISVVVSARAADNFSLAEPRNLNSAYGSLNARAISYNDISAFQSGVEDEPSQNHEMSVTIAAEVPRTDPYVFMGEKVTSLKQLFSRACHYMHFGPEALNNDSGMCVATLTQPRFPRQYGPDVAGVTNHSLSSGGNSGYNFVNPSFLTWFTPAFVGWRGSIVWRLNAFKQNMPLTGWPGVFPVSEPAGSHIERFPYETRYVSSAGIALTGLELDNLVTNNTVGGSGFSDYFMQRLDFMNGTSAAAPPMEPVNVAAVPMYSAYRMHPANPNLLSKPVDPATAEPVSYYTDYATDNVRFTVWGSVSANSLSSNFVNPFSLYVAGGDDFTPFMYLNAPTVYVGEAGGVAAGVGGQNAAILSNY